MHLQLFGMKLKRALRREILPNLAVLNIDLLCRSTMLCLSVTSLPVLLLTVPLI